MSWSCSWNREWQYRVVHVDSDSFLTGKQMMVTDSKEIVLLCSAQVWIFGDVWCSIWLAVDVWMCTASILNLCAISLDRYVAVTRPVTYPSIMSSTRAKLLIAGKWGQINKTLFTWRSASIGLRYSCYTLSNTRLRNYTANRKSRVPFPVRLLDFSFDIFLSRPAGA